MKKQLIGFVLFSGMLGTTTGFAQSGNVVKYHASMADVKYVYGVAEPVARVKSGDILETNTVDAFGNAIQIRWTEIRAWARLLPDSAH